MSLQSYQPQWDIAVVLTMERQALMRDLPQTSQERNVIVKITRLLKNIILLRSNNRAGFGSPTTITPPKKT